jgi:hypothetical protein
MSAARRASAAGKAEGRAESRRAGAARTREPDAPRIRMPEQAKEGEKRSHAAGCKEAEA